MGYECRYNQFRSDIRVWLVELRRFEGCKVLSLYDLAHQLVQILMTRPRYILLLCILLVLANFATTSLLLARVIESRN